MGGWVDLWLPILYMGVSSTTAGRTCLTMVDVSGKYTGKGMPAQGHPGDKCQGRMVLTHGTHTV